RAGKPPGPHSYCAWGCFRNFVPRPWGPLPKRGNGGLFPLQRDRVDVPAVVALLAMHGTAVAVEALVGIGIDAEVVDHQHTGIFQPHPDEAGKIEHRMSRSVRRNEESGIVGVGIEKAFDEFAADLIGVLADQGADRRDDAAARGAEFFHRVHRGFDHAGQRALPSRMCGADHAGGGVDEQYWPAIGRGDADRKPFGARDERIAARLGALPGPGSDHRVGRMYLMQADETIRRDPHPLGHPAAIFRDMRRIIVRSEAAIEALVDAAGDRALAGEEGVAQARDGRQQRRAEGHGMSAPGTVASSLRPATEVSCGSVIASTLNIEPMPPRPESVSRFSAPAMSAETSGVVFACSVTARVSLRSRLRKSPCVTGPCTRAPRSSAARTNAWKSTWAVTSACPGFFKGSAKLWRAMAW